MASLPFPVLWCTIVPSGSRFGLALVTMNSYYQKYCLYVRHLFQTPDASAKLYDRWLFCKHFLGNLRSTRCVQEYIRRESCCLRESLGADITNLLAHKPILFSSMPFQQDSRPAEQGEAVACTAGTAHFQTEQFMHSRVEHQRLEFPTLFAWMTPFFTISKWKLV